MTCIFVLHSKEVEPDKAERRGSCFALDSAFSALVQGSLHKNVILSGRCVRATPAKHVFRSYTAPCQSGAFS